ncbi:MAG: hypothetical protein ACQEP3_03080 [Patescibacteria group bacterium]
MKKETKNKIKLFKMIEADEKWKADLRTELFGQRNFLFNPLSLSQAMSGLALTTVIVFMIVFNTFTTDFEKLEPVQITQRNVELKDDVVVIEIDRDKEVLKRLTAEVEIETLSEKEKLRLAKESTEAILNEIDEVEESLIRVTASRK